MPIRRGHIAPQNTFIDTLIQKFDGQNRKFLIANAFLPSKPIIFCNNGFCNLVGYSRASIMQHPATLEFLYGPLTSPQAIKMICNALVDQEETEVSIVLYKKNGMRFMCNVIVAPVRNEGGEVRLYILTFQSENEDSKLRSNYSASIEVKDQSFSLIRQFRNVFDWIVRPWKRTESPIEDHFDHTEIFGGNMSGNVGLGEPEMCGAMSSKVLPSELMMTDQTSFANKLAEFIDPHNSDQINQYGNRFNYIYGAQSGSHDAISSTNQSQVGDEIFQRSSYHSDADISPTSSNLRKTVKSTTDIEGDSSKEDEWLKLPNQSNKKRMSMNTKNESFNKGLIVNTDIQASIHSNVADKFTQMLSFGSEVNPDRQLQSPRMHRCTLKHYGLIKAVWDWLILILVIYTAIITPYMAAFWLNDEEKRKRKGTAKLANFDFSDPLIY